MSLQEDGRRKYPRSRLLASSADRGWSTLFAELRAHPAGTVTSAVQQSVEIVIALCGPEDGLVFRAGAGRRQQSSAAPGTIWLAPIGLGGEEVVLTAPIPRALHLYLPARQFSLLAEQHNLARSPVHAIQYLGGMQDELIHQLGLAVMAEMTEESATGRMVAETSSLMLAAWLAHKYADSSLLAEAAPHRLDNARLRRVLDHIDRHLEAEITLDGLARLANLSPFHFSRMFTAATGMPPARYVSRRRLEAAMAMLATGRLSLGEIAHRCRFASQAGFTRAFRRATGMTPGEYRRLLR